MVKSMTGFGRCEIADENRRITVEIKSVNHRYLDLGIRMPKKLNQFENAIRNLLKEYVERGKTDVFISCEELTGQGCCLRYNEALAGQYLAHLRGMAQKFGVADDVTVSTLSRYPEIFVMDEERPDEQKLWESLAAAVHGAAKQLAEGRAAEGERLKEDLLGKLAEMDVCVDFIEERYPAVLAEYRSRLEEKMRELLADRQADEARIVTEAALFADKICVDEETVRLRSHIRGMRDALERGGSVGRKLDFIAQEMNREANTILSKTSDIRISETGISLKTEIEKVREQIQNLE